MGDNSSQIMSVGLKNKFIKGDNDITVIARNSESGTNAVGLYFQAQAKLADGREVVLSSDASWQFSPKAPTLKRRAVTALPKNLEPATVVQPSAADAAQLSQQGPALLAQGSAADSLKMRAALLKSDFLMRSLGRPNHEQIVTMRPNELTTLEALDLFNGKTLSAALDHGADLLVKRRWSSNGELVSWVYTSALARAPSELELRSALESLGGKPTAPAIADLLWAVLMQPEFLLLQ